MIRVGVRHLVRIKFCTQSTPVNKQCHQNFHDCTSNRLASLIHFNPFKVLSFRVSLHKYMVAMRDLLTKSSYEHYMLQCFTQACCRLPPFFFSLHCPETRREERSKKDEISHSRTHFLSDTHKRTSRPGRLRVGLSAAYSELLENAVLPVFSPVVCVWQCVCVCVCEKKVRGK